MDKHLTTQKELALAKLQKFCAYQDRSHAEVRNKLLQLKIYGDLLEEILAELITGGYLNEERFVRSYVRGKFRINHWGKNKIRQGLKAKRIPDNMIRLGMEEIDEEEYEQVLMDLLEKKSSLLNESNTSVRRKKLITYAMGRGFEYELISELMD
jgi:regulatory protein